jgi:heat shock protein HslJ
MRAARPVVAVVVLVAAASCGSGDQEADGRGAALTSRAELDGRAFVSREVLEDGTPRPLAAGTEIQIDFDGDTVRWRAGCNSFGGPFDVAGGRLVLEEMGGTAMGCDQPRMDQDEWLSAFLRSEPAITLDGDDLTLTGSAIEIRFLDEDSVTTDTELVGTTWTLDTIVDGETASSVPAGVTATLVLAADGTATGSGTCNGYGAEYSIEGGTITFVPGPTTLIACPAPQGEVENAVSATLSGDVAWAIEGDQLTLEGPDGHGLVYRATS